MNGKQIADRLEKKSRKKLKAKKVSEGVPYVPPPHLVVNTQKQFFLPERKALPMPDRKRTEGFPLCDTLFQQTIAMFSLFESLTLELALVR